MEIRYSPDYIPGSTIGIAVHNTGGVVGDPLASTSNLKATDVDSFHKSKYAMLSSLNRWGGYNFFIEADGTLTQFRAIGEETAAQRGHNFNGEIVSICLAGNFTAGVDRPTFQQIHTYRELVRSLPGVLQPTIGPHRFYQSGTGCYGSGLNDSWAREQVADLYADQVHQLKVTLGLYQRIMILINRLKSVGFKFSAELGGADGGPCYLHDNRG